MGHLVAGLAMFDSWLTKLPPCLTEGLWTSVSTQVGLGTGCSYSGQLRALEGQHALPKAASIPSAMPTSPSHKASQAWYLSSSLLLLIIIEKRDSYELPSSAHYVRFSYFLPSPLPLPSLNILHNIKIPGTSGGNNRPVHLGRRGRTWTSWVS